MKFKYILTTLIISAVVISSCKKKEIVNSTEKGSLSIEFEHKVNGTPLVLNTQDYVNANGDKFNISVFKYYVSNIKLTKSDGSVYAVPESYILVDASDQNSFINRLQNIPTGDYTSISFLIGVDQARNFAGAQDGALDPALGMFWTWNSGYIFVKLEGTSPQSTATNHTLTFHIGGVVDPNNTIRPFATNFGATNPLRIRADKNPQVHLAVNLERLFTGKQNISFATLNFTMGGANSVIVADNYSNGLFEFEHLHN